MAATTPVRSPITDTLPQEISDDPPPVIGVMLVMLLVVGFWSAVACAVGAALVWLLEN